MRTFLINTAYTSWDEAPRSRHQVANELLKYGDVYFISRNDTGLPGCEIQKYNGMHVIKPKWPFDYRFRYRLPLVNELYQSFLYKIISDQNLQNTVLVNFDHTAHKLTKKFSQSIYYCSDDHIGNDDLNISLINRYHSYTEKEVARNSSFCIATSDYLYRKLKKHNRNSRLLLLGAPEIDESHAQFKDRNDNVIKVCYVGALNERRISHEIIKDILNAENIEFHVIGQVDENFQKILEGKSKIVGIKQYEELYNYLKDMDVGVMPYNLNGVNKGGTPNKYWLYTACGLPSVSIPLNNILKWPTENGLMYLSEKEDFVNNIIRAHHEDDNDKFRKRIEYARQNTWENRIDEFISILHRFDQ